MQMSKTTQKRILVDFDGTIHSYRNGWKGAQVIDGDAVQGALDFLRKLFEGHYQVTIFSTRATGFGGHYAIRHWLIEQGLEPPIVRGIEITDQKLPAHLMIDDRAWAFEGTFPSLEFIENFKPWNRRG